MSNHGPASGALPDPARRVAETKGRGRGGRVCRKNSVQDRLGLEDGREKSESESNQSDQSNLNVEMADHHSTHSDSETDGIESDHDPDPQHVQVPVPKRIADPRPREGRHASAASSSSRPSASRPSEGGARGQPSSIFNLTTVWAGNIPVVRREDQNVPALQQTKCNRLFQLRIRSLSIAM